MDSMTFVALFEHSSIGIIISSTDGVIEKTNPYASKIFGYEHGTLKGNKIEILLPSHLREKHIGLRQQYIKDPQPRAMGSNYNLMAVKKSGEQFPVEISLSYYEAGGHKQIVSFVNDITERKKAENDLKKLTLELEHKISERTKELSDALLELSHTNDGLNQEMEQRKRVEAQIRTTLEREKELNELKSRFVSMASHEFRTPLGGILTSASLISRYPKTEDEPKREKHIQTIKRSVKNLTLILNDFLSLDKLEQGKMSSNPSHFNLNEFMNEVVEELKDTSEKNQQIKIQHADENVKLFQDREMLRNIMINLLSNAIKYSPEKSEITITSRKENSDLILEVADQGMGIPDEDQKHLFERFFRAQNSSTIQGTGLGLNIVKRYLDLMDGNINFKSVLNKGTTFIVTLPLEKKL